MTLGPLRILLSPWPVRKAIFHKPTSPLLDLYQISKLHPFLHANVRVISKWIYFLQFNFSTNFILSYELKFRISFFFLGAEIKSKINTFRPYFSKMLAKTRYQKSGSRREDIHESKWPYFKSLLFLHDSVKLRKTISTSVSKTRKHMNKLFGGSYCS